MRNSLPEATVFGYDLVDVTRQVMANYADSVQQLFSIAYRKKNYKEYEKRSVEFLEIISDMDKLHGHS